MGKPTEQTQTKTTEQQIAEHKAEIKKLKEQGSFKLMYRDLREKSVSIMRQKDLSNQERKEALATLCQKVADDFRTTEGVKK